MAKTIEGFSTRLKEAMNVKGMKQVELSEKTGIGKSSISHYINGTHSPTTDRVYLIAKALNVNEAWLLGYDVPMIEEKVDEINAPIVDNGRVISSIKVPVYQLKNPSKIKNKEQLRDKSIKEYKPNLDWETYRTSMSNSIKEQIKKNHSEHLIETIEEMVKDLEYVELERLSAFVEYQKTIKRNQ